MIFKGPKTFFKELIHGLVHVFHCWNFLGWLQIYLHQNIMGIREVKLLRALLCLNREWEPDQSSVKYFFLENIFLFSDTKVVLHKPVVWRVSQCPQEPVTTRVIVESCPRLLEDGPEIIVCLENLLFAQPDSSSHISSSLSFCSWLPRILERTRNRFQWKKRLKCGNGSATEEDVIQMNEETNSLMLCCARKLQSIYIFWVTTD